MKQKIKDFFFSKFSLIILSILYIIFSGIAFVGECLIGKTDIQYTLFLRITTIIIDVIIISTGIFTWMQMKLRKKLKTLHPIRRRITLVLYIADTLAIFLIFFVPYITRLLVLFFENKISAYSFATNSLMGISVVVVIGFLIKRILRRIKKYGNKINKLSWYIREFFYSNNNNIAITHIPKTKKNTCNNDWEILVSLCNSGIRSDQAI